MKSEIDRLQVDVYWPRDGGYGCPTVVNTLDEAASVAARLRRGGYGDPSSHPPSVIQVRRVRVDLIPLEDLPQDEVVQANN